MMQREIGNRSSSSRGKTGSSSSRTVLAPFTNKPLRGATQKLWVEKLPVVAVVVVVVVVAVVVVVTQQQQQQQVNSAESLLTPATAAATAAVALPNARRHAGFVAPELTIRYSFVEWRGWTR
jgi:hypothetical protein